MTAKPKKRKVTFLLPSDSEPATTNQQPTNKYTPKHCQNFVVKSILKNNEILTPPVFDVDESSLLSLAVLNSIINKATSVLSFDSVKSVREPSPDPPVIVTTPASDETFEEEIHTSFTFTRAKKKPKPNCNSENLNPCKQRLKSRSRTLPKLKLQSSNDGEDHTLKESNAQYSPDIPTQHVRRPSQGSTESLSSPKASYKTNLFGPRVLRPPPSDTQVTVRISPKGTDSPNAFSKFGITLRGSEESLRRTPKMADAQSSDGSGQVDLLTPSMRDDIREKDILIWIYNMIDEPARVDFEFFLKDGCMLCKLMNRIQPDCIPEDQITWEGARSKQKNIAMFLEAAEKYGVPKAKLFHMEDLLQLRHIPRVTRCIYALANLAQDDPALAPDCPRLGDEPSFVKAAKKPDVPGHRDTKDVMSQLVATLQKEDERPKLVRNHSLYQ